VLAVPFLKTSANKELRGVVSVVLARLFFVARQRDEDLDRMKRALTSFLERRLNSGSEEDHLLGLTALVALLHADLEVGIEMLLKNVENILDNVDSDAVGKSEITKNIQLITTEIIALASSNSAFVKVIDDEHAEVLLALTNSSNVEIAGRALSAITKLAIGNKDIRSKVLKNGGDGLLNTSIRLVSSLDTLSQELGLEGLSFLSFAALIKEKIIKNKELLKMIVNLASSPQRSFWYTNQKIKNKIKKQIFFFFLSSCLLKHKHTGIPW
jgi:hypothetical protein